MTNPYSSARNGALGLQPSRLPDHEFRRVVEEIRGLHALSAVVGRHTVLKPAGNELVGICCFHSERSASLRVNDAKGSYFCFGCGATGDVFRFLADKEGLSFMDALRELSNSDLPLVDPADMARKREKDDADRARDIADAIAFWGQCVDLRGTPGEVYVREVRAIDAPMPPTVRFGRLPSWRNEETGEWNAPRPCVVGAVFDRVGAVIGIQRIFLKDDGRDKAAMKRPKKSLGRVRGGSMRLGPVQPTVVLCEGPEDGWTLMQELAGVSVWPTLGTALMGEVDFPEDVTEAILAGQNDGAGRAAVEVAAEKLLARGLSVRTMFPDPAFKDFNDQLRGIRK